MTSKKKKKGCDMLRPVNKTDHMGQDTKVNEPKQCLLSNSHTALHVTLQGAHTKQMNPKDKP